MAYSTDLREKIVRAYDEGLGSQRAIAELFGVSRSFVEKLLARRRSTGQIAPLPHGGGRRPNCDAKDLNLVRQCIKEQPDATLAEVGHTVHHEHGTLVSRPAKSAHARRWRRPSNRRWLPLLSQMREHGLNIVAMPYVDSQTALSRKTTSLIRSQLLKEKEWATGRNGRSHRLYGMVGKRKYLE